jgi:hypothetical protein
MSTFFTNRIKSSTQTLTVGCFRIEQIQPKLYYSILKARNFRDTEVVTRAKWTDRDRDEISFRFTNSSVDGKSIGELNVDVENLTYDICKDLFP